MGSTHPRLNEPKPPMEIGIFVVLCKYKNRFYAKAICIHLRFCIHRPGFAPALFMLTNHVKHSSQNMSFAREKHVSPCEVQYPLCQVFLFKTIKSICSAASHCRVCFLKGFWFQLHLWSQSVQFPVCGEAFGRFQV